MQERLCLLVFRLELDNMAAFLKGAAAYKKKIGFTGNLLLEPKPQVQLCLQDCP